MPFVRSDTLGQGPDRSWAVEEVLAFALPVLASGLFYNALVSSNLANEFSTSQLFPGSAALVVHSCVL